METSVQVKNQESSLSWEERIEKVAKTIGKTVEETKEILSSPPYHINEKNGLDLLDDEEATPFGDLRQMFCEKNNVPLPQLRLAIKFLRGKNSQKEEIDPVLSELQSRFGIKVKLSDLDTEELLPYYNPKRKNIIHTILEERYGKYGAFIAFKISSLTSDSLSVAIEETLNYIADLEQGFPQEKMIEINGELEPLFKVGEYPSSTVLEEDPFFPGNPLKRGRSTVNRLNWENVEKEERQFFRILLESDLSFSGERTICHNVNDRLMLSQWLQKPLSELKTTFPESYAKFKQLKKLGNLPSLLVENSVRGFCDKTNMPFTKTANKKF